MRRSAVLMLMLLCGGCIPYAYAIPPAELSVSGDVRLRTGEKPDIPVELRAEVHPLGIPLSQHRRENDVGLGYLALIATSPSAPTWQGGFLEYSRVLYQRPRDDTSLTRVRAGLQARLMYDGRNELGPGAVARLALDYSSFVDSDFEGTNEDGGLLGHALGETGFGVFTEVGYVRFPSSDGWTFSIGLNGDLPAAAGIGWVWLWALISR